MSPSNCPHKFFVEQPLYWVPALFTIRVRSKLLWPLPIHHLCLEMESLFRWKIHCTRNPKYLKATHLRKAISWASSANWVEVVFRWGGRDMVTIQILSQKYRKWQRKWIQYKYWFSLSSHNLFTRKFSEHFCLTISLHNTKPYFL